MAWLTTAAALVGPLLAAIVAIWTWFVGRRAERTRTDEQQAARYLVPFLFAAQDLQSRLYNIACLAPEKLLHTADDRRRFARETLYLVAQYFFWEALVLRFTPVGRSPASVKAVGSVRTAFARADGPDDRDPWCLFHVRQHAWGAILEPPTADGDADPAPRSLFDFEDHLASQQPLRALAEPMLSSFEGESGLAARSRVRLAKVQVELVGLLNGMESRIDRRPPVYRPIARLRHTPYTLAGDHPRERAVRTHDRCALCGADGARATPVEHRAGARTS